MASKKTQKPITDEIASIEKDIFGDYLAAGAIITNPDKVIRSEAGGKGIELFEDLLRDDQVAADMDTRRNAVIGREWDVVPPTEDPQDAKIALFVKEVLTSFNHDSARKALLSGQVLGYKPSEIMWDYSEGDVWVKEIIPRAARRFVFGKDRELRLLTPSNMVEGEVVPDKKFQLFVSPCDNGSPYGQGLGRALYWPVWFKKNGIKFWLIFSNKFGSPTAVGKYPPGTPKEKQTDLLEACEAIQQESAVTIPNTMMIEYLEAARTSSVNNYDLLCKYMDKKITKLILGHTGASESTPGKLGGEDRAQDVQNKNLKYDADLLCEQENKQLIRWIVDYNFPGVKKYPRLWIRTEEEDDLKPQAERDELLVNIGVPIAKRYFYETYGADMEPQAGEEVVEPRQPASPFGLPSPEFGVRSSEKQPSGAFTECRCGKTHTSHRSHSSYSFAEADASWIAEYLKRMQPLLQNAKAGAMDEIKAWLESQETPTSPEVFTEKVKEILGNSYAKIDQRAVTDAVADIYGSYKNTTPGMQTTAAFGGADLRAIGWLSDVDRMFYSKFISNPDANDAVTKFLTEHYLKGGEGLFGRGDPATIEEFVNLLGQKTTEISGFQAQRIADTSVQRIRNFAHISQLAEAGTPKVRIVEPTEECDFCRAMNGREIEVGTAYNLMQELMGKSPNAFVSWLQENLAVLTNAASFIERGVLPPYHPFCHGFVVTA